MISLILAMACTGGEYSDPVAHQTDSGQSIHHAEGTLPDPVPAATYIEGDAQTLLRRMSLDIRGVLPSQAERERVGADMNLLNAVMNEMVHDARLEERLVSLFAERWLTRIDVFEIEFHDYFLPEEQEYEFEKSVGEEPLRLMAHVVVEDRPWTEIVTANYTMANELLGDLWPIDYPDEGEGWQPSVYTDGRPGAGVLTTNGLWWRYVTDVSNKNRSRVAAINKLLLCNDILSRPVSFAGSSSLVEEGTESAINNLPYCVSCHASIEPIAGVFFGFWSPMQYTRIEYERYHAERELMWQDYLDAEPAWFGEPIEGLVDLGRKVADDSRFQRCGVEQMTSALWRRSIQMNDWPTIEALLEEFKANELRMKPLMVAIMQTSPYRAVSLAEDAHEDTVESEVTTRMMGPSLFHQVITDTFGYQWTFQGADQLDTDSSFYEDRVGYRVLMGGVDGHSITTPPKMPSLTWSITVRRVAQAAGIHAATADLTTDDGPGVLIYVNESTEPTDTQFNNELIQLHERLYGSTPDAAWIESITELWIQMERASNPLTAWGGVLSTMIRDPAFMTY